ncbi:Hypothetical predicted protein [Paramuricea clavata]|uniref:Integrase zinc-binding domain-containing protein n=1 Tax=Paramuricea clavata TaxID=317549 RepID=A0A7D9DIQ4_PARCT|nr:Hypothetical predicted protein [Paramuricea clavata]
MKFRRHARKPGEDIQVFAYGLETLLSRAIPNIGNDERDTLLKQQFIEGSSPALKRELLQRPSPKYEETVKIPQQLDFTPELSSPNSDHDVEPDESSERERIEQRVNSGAPVKGNPTTTTPGKLPRADPLLVLVSTREGSAIPINSVLPTAIFIKATLSGHLQPLSRRYGATVSLVNKNTVQGHIRECKLKARGAGGENLHVIGMTDIHVRVNGLNVVHTFVVVNMQNQCIFGVDFLKANGKVVNIAQELLSWDSGETRLLIEAAAPTLLDKYVDVFVNVSRRVFVNHPHLPDEEIVIGVRPTLIETEWSLEEIYQAQHDDPVASTVHQAKLNTPAEQEAPSDWTDDSELRRYRQVWKQLEIIVGVLHRRVSTSGRKDGLVLVVFRKMRADLLRLSHNDPSSGHMGINRCVERLQPWYYWPRMTSEVHLWVAECGGCHQRKSSSASHRPPMENIQVSQPMEW